jgi:hypothetical protein
MIDNSFDPSLRPPTRAGSKPSTSPSTTNTVPTRNVFIRETGNLAVYGVTLGNSNGLTAGPGIGGWGS